MHSARNPFSLDVFFAEEQIEALDTALATALSVMGAGHILLAPIYYRHESAQNQAWFAGSGLALALLGMLNLARVRGDDATVRAMSKVANPAGTIFLATVAAILREPQTFAALAVSAGLTALALRK